MTDAESALGLIFLALLLLAAFRLYIWRTWWKL